MQARIESLERQHDEDVMRLHVELASDRRRLVALENPKPGKPGTSQLNELYVAMKSAGRYQIGYKEVAGMLKVSKRRANQLHASIALDSRFRIVRSESHSQKLLIRLNEVD